MNSEPEYPEEYYEHLAQTLGDAPVAWARLSREEREKELRWLHDNFNTPDDLSVWPPELGGDQDNIPPVSAPVPNPDNQDAKRDSQL